MESEDIPSTPIEPIVRRHKVSVPDVPMSAMMSPSCSISSKASEPVTAVRINSSKTQMKSSVGSTIKSKELYMFLPFLFVDFGYFFELDKNQGTTIKNI